MSEGIEWIQCESLLDALNLALVDPLPKRRSRKQKSGGDDGMPIPGSMKELGLDNSAIDDDEDYDDEGFR